MEPDDGLLSQLPLLARLVQRECARRRMSEQGCEDLLGQVHLHLCDHGRRAWKHWEEAGRKTSYLARLVRNVAIDVCRGEVGRRRHSLAAVHAGYWALRLEELHVWDGHELEPTIRILQENEGCPLPSSELRNLAATLRARSTPVVSVEPLDELPICDPSPGAALECERNELAFRIAKAVNRGIADVTAAEDRVLLRAVFYKGLTVTAVASSLGMPRRRAYSRIETICRRFLRSALEDEGLTATEILAALEAGLPELPIDWHRLEHLPSDDRSDAADAAARTGDP